MPTATDRDFLDVRVSDIRRIAHDGQDHHVVVLLEPESGRRLPIWIGREHALELALRPMWSSWSTAHKAAPRLALGQATPSRLPWSSERPYEPTAPLSTRPSSPKKWRRRSPPSTAKRLPAPKPSLTS
jgi:hypothetical protein